jgi:hypothetical protein
MNRVHRVLACIGVLWIPIAAFGQSVDWTERADVERLEVLTTDEDGEARETTIWLLVLDGNAYIRTSNTRWGRNALRDPEIALRIGDEEIPVRVELVSDEATRERIQQGFREKYGFMDRLTGLYRSSDPKIMHATAR